MTTYATARHARVIEFDQKGNVVTVPHRAVRLNPIGEQTQRLFPIPRDTDPLHTSPFAVVDPATTGSLPALADLAAELRRRKDAADLARIAAERRTGAPGRHRAERPSLLARLFGRGRRDGA